MSILAEERQQVIMECLEREGKVMVIPLSEQLEVSTETVRRDLLVLEKEGRLRRVHGGALKLTYRNDEAPYYQRQKLYPKEKKAIGMRAAELVQDGSTIVIDVGTTTLELAQAIQGKKRLTIITNSIPVASSLLDSINMGKFTGKVIILGGEANPEQRSASGALCAQMMSQFRVDKAFLSVGGISLLHGITDYDVNEASMSRIFASSAQEVIVLADHSKLGVSTFTHLLPFDQVDIIISDQDCPVEWVGHMEQQEVLWVNASISDTRGDDL
jgi:DeoR family transcriptional regulator, fructose operon transcriptional repressor